jgi:hypothetical protein
VQKSVPVKLARLLLDITIGCCFDSHPRIDSVLQNSGFRYGLLENAIVWKNQQKTTSECGKIMGATSFVNKEPKTGLGAQNGGSLGGVKRLPSSTDRSIPQMQLSRSGALCLGALIRIASSIKEFYGNGLGKTPRGSWY